MNVELGDDIYEMKMLSAATRHATVHIQLTETNLEVLLKRLQQRAPKQRSKAKEGPTLSKDCKGVYWNHQRHAVFCKYMDNNIGKMKSKHFKVPHVAEASMQQQLVLDATTKCNTWHGKYLDGTLSDDDDAEEL